MRRQLEIAFHIFFCMCSYVPHKQTNTRMPTLHLALFLSLWSRLLALAFHRCAHYTGHPQTALTLSLLSFSVLSVLCAALFGFHARWQLELVNSCSGSTHRLVCRTWLCFEVVARPIAAQHSYIIHVIHCLCVRVCAHLHMYWLWVSVSVWVCVRYLWLHGLNFC